VDHPSNALVSSIRDKNSRNIEKFGDKAIVNSKMEVKENNSQYLINSESMKNDLVPHNMSFDVNQRQRVLKPKKSKQKEDATKALLNFEDMKRKIMKDYAKKNSKEIGTKVSQPSHHRNGAGVMAGYFSINDMPFKRIDGSVEDLAFRTNDDDKPSKSETKKKSSKKSQSKNNFAAIYDPNQGANWASQQPLSQKSINTGEGFVPKERPNSNKRHTPSKKKSSRKFHTFKLESRSKTQKQGPDGGNLQFLRAYS
jgi:hypothetical protein